MRPGQQNKRMRGRNRKGPNPLTRSFESNGGDVKICGTALHIAEKYVQLSRDAHSSGDRVAAENYLQHAEHYYRILAAAQAQMPQPQPVMRNDDDNGDDDDDEGDIADVTANGSGQPQSEPQQGPVQYGGEQPVYNPGDPQPYVNGNGGGQDQPVDSQPAENRGGENRERSGFRGGRRRRPFRERQGGERGADRTSGEAASGEAAQSAPAEPTVPVAED